MPKTKNISSSLQILFIGISIILLMLIIFLISFFMQKKSPEIQTYVKNDVTVVIDAGHGGEDGGASDKLGNLEKDLNLAMAKKLEELFASAGIKTLMTRSEDKLLYDPNTDYHGRKKILDMRERVKIVNECDNPILISIHMNAFPEDEYRGLQVYYSVNDPTSEKIAEGVQTTVHSLIQKENKRKIKQGKDIFLLDRINVPAILVECGFLSNPDEAALLNDEEYQDMLVFCIFHAVISEIQ